MSDKDVFILAAMSIVLVSHVDTTYGTINVTNTMMQQDCETRSPV